jgi:hypothetical protein
MELDKFFQGCDRSKHIFEPLNKIIAPLRTMKIRTTKSQIAFVRKKPLAWVWIPDRYLHGNHSPLVLTLSFPYRDESPRWKETVEPRQGHFTHHLELYSEMDIDQEVNGWLKKAWNNAL